eukprot:GHVQ01039432.1.p2 GENE.GHVQ01039432.1~~GHVQ01039432.1.p2  ORF type:complete len:287 (-),score=22.29 GHVQ01039432.1:1349-2209(-)
MRGSTQTHHAEANTTHAHTQAHAHTNKHTYTQTGDYTPTHPLIRTTRPRLPLYVYTEAQRGRPAHHPRSQLQNCESSIKNVPFINAPTEWISSKRLQPSVAYLKYGIPEFVDRNWDTRQGADILLVAEPQRKRVQNYPAVFQHRDAFEKHFQKMLGARDLEEVTQPPYIISPLNILLKTKLDGSVKTRMIVDFTASGLNQCIDAPRFSMDTIADVARMARPSDYMMTIDVTDAFTFIHTQGLPLPTGQLRPQNHAVAVRPSHDRCATSIRPDAFLPIRERRGGVCR